MQLSKERLKEIYLDQRSMFNRRKDLIMRDVDLIPYLRTQQVVIISGIRRSGKSALLFLIKEQMGLMDADFCYFNFDDERAFANTGLPEQLFTLHLELYGKEPVLFFDEIQNVPGWEKFINRMHERGLKIFVTGSNAVLLSSEISTSLTGRNKVIALFPFSFREFLRAIGEEYDLLLLDINNKSLLQKSFNRYLEHGGFPLVVKEQDPELINDYFQDILYRDIIARYKLSQVMEIRQIGIFLASNCGKRFSYNTLQQISGVKSTSSVKDYLWYYEQSHLFLFMKKFDYSVKKQVMNPRKAYTIDTGFSNRLGFSFSQNKGRILENAVLLELRRRGHEVFYHSGKYECDFLIREGIAVTRAIQVTWELQHHNAARELNGLQEAMQTYNLSEGLLITSTEPDPALFREQPGIQAIPAWKWLLDN